jgi:hypothetical protein
VAVRNALDYIPNMAQTIEKDVAEAERKVAELSAQALVLPPRQNELARQGGAFCRLPYAVHRIVGN